MPIPDFDLNRVLPPHLGNPTLQAELSPYAATTVELCHAFATSPDRIKILQGYIRLRQVFQTSGLVEGFQLLDGSFLEDIEALENRPPEDIDVATFYWGFSLAAQQQLIANLPELVDHSKLKGAYMVDHYFVDAGVHPAVTVELSQYWYGLFSHRRDRLWKGMLRIELNTPNDDALASVLLGQRSAPQVVSK